MLMLRFAKSGFIPVVMLLVGILAAAGLVAGVTLVQRGTNLINNAYSPDSFLTGRVVRLAKCLNQIVCYELIESSDGTNHYLVLNKPVSRPESTDENKPDSQNSNNQNKSLATYVGQLVGVSGVEIKNGKPPYLLVLQIDPTAAKGRVCTPRPTCLDSKPACKIMEPTEGWCPKISPAPSPTTTLSPTPAPTGCRPCPKGMMCPMNMRFADGAVVCTTPITDR